jgi:hypothetical protein
LQARPRLMSWCPTGASDAAAATVRAAWLRVCSSCCWCVVFLPSCPANRGPGMVFVQPCTLPRPCRPGPPPPPPATRPTSICDLTRKSDSSRRENRICDQLSRRPLPAICCRAGPGSMQRAGCLAPGPAASPDPLS